MVGHGHHWRVDFWAGEVGGRLCGEVQTSVGKLTDSSDPRAVIKMGLTRNGLAACLLGEGMWVAV